MSVPPPRIPIMVAFLIHTNIYNILLVVMYLPWSCSLRKAKGKMNNGKLQQVTKNSINNSCQNIQKAYKLTLLLVVGKEKKNPYHRGWAGRNLLLRVGQLRRKWERQNGTGQHRGNAHITTAAYNHLWSKHRPINIMP